MLREISGMTQDTPAEERRWFHDDYFDLFVRRDPDREVVAMDLCYGIGASEWALTWRKSLGFFLDGPENEAFDADGLTRRFAREAGELPADIANFVLRALREYSDSDLSTRARRRQFRRERWQRAAG